MALFFVVERLHHLTKRTFSYERIYFISIEELFTVLYDVIMVIVIIAIVVQLPLFLVRAVFALCLGRPTLFLCVINLQEKYVFNFAHTVTAAGLFAKYWQHYWSLRLLFFNMKGKSSNLKELTFGVTAEIAVVHRTFNRNL